MVRYLIPALVFTVLIGFFARGLSIDPSDIPSPLIGKPAPVFRVSKLIDPASTIGTEDLTGKVAILNFWSSWCPPCRQEHPYLMELAKSGTVPIYGVNTADKQVDAIAVLSQLGNPYIANAFDPDGRVGLDWGVIGAPETFLIGPDGTVLHKHISPLTPRIWEEEFLPRIAATRRSR